jgi:hypothetical protein
MGRCKHCGGEVGEGELFCGNCGTRLSEETTKEAAGAAVDAAEQTADTEPEGSQAESPEPETTAQTAAPQEGAGKKKKGGLFAIIGAAALALLLIGFGLRTALKTTEPVGQRFLKV